MKLRYPAVFYPWDEEDDPGYTVDVPDLLGCVTQGRSLAESILMGIDAASGWIVTSMELGRPIPPPSAAGNIMPDEEIGLNGFVDMLPLDIGEYSKKYGQEPVKKTLEIPAYLNTFAESENIDISGVAQNALSDLYQSRILA
jgi:predicted RNase H-like HicB family nuclease